MIINKLRREEGIEVLENLSREYLEGLRLKIPENLGKLITDVKVPAEGIEVLMELIELEQKMKQDFFLLGGGRIQGAIFDLDGVLVDTAKYHYLAWRRLARELGFDFSEHDNERLKGVSRMRSLEILLEIGNYTMSDAEKFEATARKNDWYVGYLRTLDENALLPGSREFLKCLKTGGVKIALGSASKNAPLILERLGVTGLFDAVIDGNAVSKAKPDPEVFLKGAEALGLSPDLCVVFEDALAGIEAARAGGMRVIAIGKPELLPGADRYVSSLQDMLLTYR